MDTPQTYPIDLTQGEIILIREVVRHARLLDYPLHLGEIFSVDRKLTAKLADIFDQQQGIA